MLGMGREDSNASTCILKVQSVLMFMFIDILLEVVIAVLLHVVEMCLSCC